MFNFKKLTYALLVSSTMGMASIASAQSPASAFVQANQTQDAAPLKHTVFLILKTRDAWLQLSVQERFAYIGKNIFPIIKNHPLVKVRFYDAEFYTARLSDVMLIETSNLRQYEKFIDALRDQEFWYKYFDVQDLIMTTENPMVDLANMRTIAPK
jgi:Darcynin, domain of unknown function